MQVARLQARRLLEKINVDGYVTNLHTIISKLGVAIYKTDKLPNNILGSARKSKTGKWIIIVNSNQIYTRLRFTIAHEIGHIVLNHSNTEPEFYSFFSGGITTYKERQANVFATELLMPVPKFKELYFNKGITSVFDIANYFKVSKQAAEIRITEIAG